MGVNRVQSRKKSDYAHPGGVFRNKEKMMRTDSRTRTAVYDRTAKAKRLPGHVLAMIREADDLGCPLMHIRQRNGHYRMSFVAFDHPVFTGSTPSDHRSAKNGLSTVRRMAKAASQRMK